MATRTGALEPKQVRGALVNSADRSIRWCLDDGAVAWREVQDEVVILHLPTASYLSLNGSGRVLWLRLSDGATVGDLASLLQETYDITAEDATLDSEVFLSSLQERKLVRPLTASA